MRLQTLSSIRVALLGSVIMFLAGGSAQADGLKSLAGTWELNVAKSRFTPGTEIRSQIRTYEIQGDEVKQSTDSVDHQGRPVHSQWVARYDGKDYPLDDNPDADTIAIKQTGELTAVTSLKKNGKVVQTVTRTLSADGKTCTFEYKGTNSKGQKIDNLLVFDRR